MMKFREVKANIVTLLGAAAAGQYRVSGYQEQDVHAEEITGTDRLVQVFVGSSEIPKSGAGYGPYKFDVTARIYMTVSEPAYADLTVLNNPASTPVQIAAALAAAEPAAEKADTALDELFELVFNELMKGDNYDLGMSIGEVANRWMGSFEKESPQPRGDRVVLSGMTMLTFTTSEDVTSSSIADLDFIDSDLTIQDDGDPKAGVLEEY